VIVGVDEVGRGCWFGPVFAAAVCLSESAAQDLSDLGLTDSKALSPRRRAALVPEIEARATCWALGQAAARDVDAMGIRVATELAMLRALERLPCSPELVLVDGVLPLRLWKGPQRTIVRGDSKEASIAAASVLAKEARDALIRRLANRFPGYALERHAGYGTAQHRAALLASGPTPMHRHTFLTKVFAAS
jgi:ribonuclease HII|tara:strand:+ start:95 stop:667 length:573 start_codon:yes stop_codon:yes gene_type:complete